MKITDLFAWLFNLRNDQIMFCLFIISIYLLYKKNEELIKRTSERLDEKDRQILDIVEKVNETQLELIKTLGKLRGNINTNQTKLEERLVKIDENIKKLG